MRLFETLDGYFVDSRCIQYKLMPITVFFASESELNVIARQFHGNSTAPGTVK